MGNQINYAVVDRVVGTIAVLVFDNGLRLTAPASGLSEGDVVVPEEDGYRVDREETLRRRERIKDRRRRIFKRRGLD
ncbi:MAG: DUF3006 family protein [Clostridia bacterium]|nr:DUF3006 family protein [Clostridia bacterium]